jgi:hypothetical protein
MQGASRKQLPRGVGVFVVPLGADVAREDNLPNLLAVLGDVFQYALGQIRFDDADRQADHEAVALAGHADELFSGGESIP